MKHTVPVRSWLQRAVVVGVMAVSARAAEQLIIEKLERRVTAAEVQAFASFMRTVPVPTDNVRNAMVYGSGGMAVESLERMVEISGERELLDLALRFTDRTTAFLLYQRHRLATTGPH